MIITLSYSCLLILFLILINFFKLIFYFQSCLLILPLIQISNSTTIYTHFVTYTAHYYFTRCLIPYTYLLSHFFFIQYFYWILDILIQSVASLIELKKKRQQKKALNASTQKRQQNKGIKCLKKGHNKTRH